MRVLDRGNPHLMTDDCLDIHENEPVHAAVTDMLLSHFLCRAGLVLILLAVGANLVISTSQLGN